MEIRTERTVKHKGSEHYDVVKHYCHESKNLYNYANYILRQNMVAGNWELHNFYRLRQHLRYLEDEGNPWGRQATTHHAAATLQILINNWNAYFSALKSFAKFPEKFKERPKPPGYLKKNGEFVLSLDGSRISHKNGIIKFSKALNGLVVPFNKAEKIQQVRIIPKTNHYIIEVVYRIEVPDKKPDNSRYLSIDLGVSNFATIISNVEGFKPLVMNGKGLQAINQYYNKQIAHYKEVTERVNGSKWSNRLSQITDKRNARINDQLHKMSRYIINAAKNWNISQIVIGYNPEWKQNVNIGKVNNQKFVQLPYLRFIHKLMYKGDNEGIDVICHEESYTSKTSFIDGEYPQQREQYAGKRVKRGLFKSADGTLINADVNGAYQILKKVSPNAYDGVAGVSFHPMKVNVVTYK